MDRHVRNRLVIGHAAIALVLVLGAATTFIALEAAVRRDDRTTAIEHRLALIRDLRADARALALAARRYLLSGDWKDRDHVFAVNDQVSKRRDALRGQTAYPAGWAADLGEYTATLTTAMARNSDDIATVAHFEDELQRVRNPLDITLDSIVARERSELASQKSMTLARRAQWASVVASVLGLALVLATGVSVFRLFARRLAGANSPSPPGSLRVSPCTFVSIRMSDLIDRSSVPSVSATSPAGTDLGDHWLVDLSNVVEAHSLIVLVDVDTLQPIETATLRALDALGHSCAQLVIYSREPSVDAIRLRVELPRASWLYPSSVIGPSDIIALLRRGTADARVLAIGIRPELLRSLEPRDAVLSRAGTDDVSHDASILRSTLWAIVKLRYRIRGTTAQ